MISHQTKVYSDAKYGDGRLCHCIKYIILSLFGNNKVRISYCIQIRPDGQRLAVHTTVLPDQPGYRIFNTDLDGADRIDIASHSDHLYFGLMWSPDGDKMAFCRAVVSDARLLTEGYQNKGADHPVWV
jgi:hypothetical protein